MITTINLVGYRYTKEQILEGALSAALEGGVSQLTFGRLAKQLGISDRVIVYYFPSKDDLVSEVLMALGSELQRALAPIFVRKVSDHAQMLRTAWPIVARDDLARTFALFFEASGLAASGSEPYRTLVPRLVEGWIEWAASFIDGAASHRRREAAATIAVLDGLLLLRQLAGADAADLAAKALMARRSPAKDVGRF